MGMVDSFHDEDAECPKCHTKVTEWQTKKLETTAQTLRADYEKKLSQLQESCSHKKTKWMDLAWAPVLSYGRALVCLRCEKRLKLKRGWESLRAITPKQTKHLRNK